MNKKALIIDSDLKDAEKAVEFLGNWGIDTEVAKSGAEGLEMFEQIKPDLVLVNMIMPDIPGAQVIKDMRQTSHGAKLPIYFLSSLASSGTSIIKSSGATGQISKPVNLSEVGQVVFKHFGEMEPVHREKRSKSRRKTSEKEIDWRNTNLSKISFSKLLAKIYKAKANGVLGIVDSYDNIRITFSSGQPVGFDPINFGEFLLQNRYISQDQLKEMRNLGRRPGIHALETAISMNLLGEDILDELYLEFIMKIVQTLSHKQKAVVKFSRETTHGNLTFNIVELIIEGVRQTNSLDRLQQIFKKGDRYEKQIYFAIDTTSLEKISAITSQIISGLHHAKTLKELVFESNKQELTVLQVVYSLILAGVLTFRQVESFNSKRGKEAVADSVSQPKPTEPEPIVPIEPSFDEMEFMQDDSIGLNDLPPLGGLVGPSDEDLVEPGTQDLGFDLDFDLELAEEISSPVSSTLELEPEPDFEPDREFEPELEDNLALGPELDLELDLGPEIMPEPVPKPVPEPVSEPEPEPEPDEEEVNLSDLEIKRAAARFLRSGAYSKAQACYEELLGRGIESPQILMNMAQATFSNRFTNLSRNRMLDVLWVIKRALALDPQYLPAYTTLGNILEKEGKIDLAREMYNQAMAIEVNHPPARTALRRLDQL